MPFLDRIYYKNKHIFNEPILLKGKERANPQSVIDTFFVEFSLAEVRDILYDLRRVALSTENLEFAEPKERSDLIFNMERIERMIEAASLLVRNPKKR